MMSNTQKARSLRIAMVAPPWFHVPPAGYGGIENVVATLTDELVKLGHHVTLLSAGDHATAADQHIAVFQSTPTEPVGTAFIEAWYAARVDASLRNLDIDIVHDHTLAGVLTASGRSSPTLHTVHNPVHARFGDYLRALAPAIRTVALSRTQVRAAPDLPWVGTVANGIDIARFPFRRDKSDYLLFLGRVLPEKGTHLAIDAAEKAGRRIVIAGRCDEPAESAYFNAEIKPRLGPTVEWHGPANFVEKVALLASAAAVLCPFQWPEPFCLVAIEAMACGTPVIATPMGAAPEVIVPQKTGFLAAPSDLANAIARLDDIDPGACRSHAERTFNGERMARGYERIYRSLVEPRIPTSAPIRRPESM
jgi:glycosyltransferase involved in cell wall biosynthesis